MSKRETCEGCRYCVLHAATKSNEWYECHANPPVVLALNDDDGRYDRPAINKVDPACRFYEKREDEE
jgi:hypothetical protein